MSKNKSDGLELVEEEAKPKSKAEKTEKKEVSHDKLVEMVEEIYEQNKKIKLRLTLILVGNYVKFLILFIPLILGLLFLLPLIKETIPKYNALINSGSPNPFSDILSNTSPEQLEEIIKTFRN